MDNNPKYNITRSPLPAVSWSSFFVAVQEAMKLHLATVGPPGQIAPKFIRDYPKAGAGQFDTQFDVILFRIVSSKRSGTDRTGTERIPKGPNAREVKKHPTKDGYHLVTFGWWETMLVEFTVLAKSNERADEILEWFHRFMMRFTFDIKFFSSRGINLMVFDQRGEDKLNNMYGQELNERVIRYEARLELLTSFESKDITSLHVTVQGNPIQEINIEEEFKV